MNPHASSDSGAVANQMVGLEGARVVTAPSHTEGDDVGHQIEVKPDTLPEPVIAEVVVGQAGDVVIPSQGERVIIGYRTNGRPVVLGSRYSLDDPIPTFEAGERVIGHPLSDAHVRLASDGTVHVEGDGDVVVNGGSTRPVTDVDFTNETITRADGVFVPSGSQS